MKRIVFFISLIVVTLSLYAQEPKNNLGRSLSQMKQMFPELRYIKTDSKGDEYEDGYPENGIGSFFYFKNNYVIEECTICSAKDGFPLDWYNSLVSAFNKDYSYALQENTRNSKNYVFSAFNIRLIYVQENGTATALIVYEKSNTGQRGYSNSRSKVTNQARPLPTPSNDKVEWYNIDYTEKEIDVQGMQSIGSFKATSSPSLFGSRTWSDAFYSAIKKIQKKAAKKEQGVY